MIRVVIDVAAPEGLALAVKEQLAMLLERYGDTRVVSVTPTGPGRNFEGGRDYGNFRVFGR